VARGVHTVANGVEFGTSVAVVWASFVSGLCALWFLFQSGNWWKGQKVVLVLVQALALVVVFTV